ncbi:MAG: hypothetical protein KAW67_08650, partial [Candidatus Eisenbacteria sp.]|nr:hypothetical protein [Candidatus Eisenbacteria bacterium]
YLGWAAEFEPAIEYARRALELDPLDYDTHLVRIFSARITRRSYTEAMKLCEAALELFPGDDGFEEFLLWHRVWSGTDVEESVDKFLKQWPNTAATGVVCAKTGRRDEALRIIDRQDDKHREGIYYAKARIYAALGEVEKTLELLEKTWDEEPRILLQLNSDPELDFLRGERGFKDLIERSGIPMGELAYLSE